MRSSHTKQMLADTLKNLLSTKTLDKISIRELTAEANVNRQTFYYHFEDIYDLLRWTIQNEALIHLQDKPSEQLWQEGVLQLFRYVEQNKAFAVNAFQSLGLEFLRRFFYTEVYEIIEKVTLQMSEGYSIDAQYIQFLAHHYTLSLSSLIISWMQDDIDATPEQIIEMINITIEDQKNGAQLRCQNMNT